MAMTGIDQATEAASAKKNVVPKVSGVPVPESLRRPIHTRSKVLMGSGPTNYTQRVIEALSKPIMGIYSDEFYQIMDEIKEGVQYLFQTTNPITFCTTGSGNAGMETVLSNLIEEGDVVLLAVTGAFGHRAVDMATRYGADVRVLEAKLGQNLKYEQIRAHIEAHAPKLLFIVHGDSSSGVLQPISELGELCHRNNCLLVVDAVGTFGALEVLVDKWQIDAAFSASQKAVGAPAGLAPVTFSPRAMNAIQARKTPPRVYYYDAKYLASRWACFDEKRYPHHTPSAVVAYAFRESLSEIIEQGLDVFRDRHTDNAQRLYEGLQNIGLELFVERPEDRMPTITSIRIPHGVNWPKVSKYLDDRYGLELSTGYGITEDLIFRIGLMNVNATHQKVDFVLRALYDAFKNAANFIAPRSKVYY